MRTRPFLSAFLSATLAASGAVPTRADEPPPKGEAKPGDKPSGTPAEKPAKPPELKVLTDAEAAPHLERLKEAAKAKKAEAALPALVALAGVTHPAFEAALARLLPHPSAVVAAGAALAIGERGTAKSGPVLWKGWTHATNAMRVDVKGAILEAMGRVGAGLDAKQFGEVESIWRQAPNADAMNAVSLYFRLIKTDKRPCKMLALWLQEPKVGNVNDASNPPAEWWQARWLLWSRTKPGAIAALEAITGQHFDSTADAKIWFEANPKFGVRW